MPGYSFDAPFEGEQERLARIESRLDPHSTRIFEENAVQPDEGFPAFVAKSIDQLRERLLASGWVEPADLDALCADLRDLGCAFPTFECWVASGRRPARRA